MARQRGVGECPLSVSQLVTFGQTVPSSFPLSRPGKSVQRVRAGTPAPRLDGHCLPGILMPPTITQLPSSLLSPTLSDFEQESGIETAMRFSPDVALAVSTTPAVLPTMDIQPVDTPLEELPSERPTPEPATSLPVVTEAPEEPNQRAATISTATATTAATTIGSPTVAMVPATVATATPRTPSTATTSVIRTTGIQRLLPLPLTTAATAQATTPAVPSPPTTVAVLDTEAPTPRLVSTATSRPRALPRPATTQEPDIPEKSTLPLGTTASGPTMVAQVRRLGEDRK